MALQYGLTPIPMTGGVDTRTDSKALKPPKLAVCKNVRFTSPGKHQKRQGYRKILPSPQALASYLVHDGDALGAIGADHGTSTYQADAVSGNWSTSSDFTNSLGIRPNIINVDTKGSLTLDTSLSATATADAVSQVVLDDYRVTQSWSGTSALGNLAIFNRSTGIMVSYFSATSSINSRLLGVGNTLLYISVSGANLLLRTYDVKAHVHGIMSNPNSGTGINIAANLGANSVFDVCMAGSNMLIVYNTTTLGTVKAMLVDTAGTILSSVNLATGAGNTLDAVGCSFGNGKIIISAFDNTSHNPSEWVYNSTLGALTTSLVNTRPGAMGALTVDFVTNCSSSSGITFTLYSVRSANTYDYAVAEVGNTTSFGGLIAHTVLHSRMCVPNNRDPWVIFSYIGSSQSFYFLYSMNTLVQPGALQLSGRFLPGVLTGVPKVGLANLQVVDADTLAYPALNFADDPTRTAASATNVTINLTPEFITSVPGVLIPGGLPAVWDGKAWKEQGFCTFPDNLTATPSNAGGSLLPSTIYSYLVVYDSLDVRGFRDQSTFGQAVVTTTGAADNRVTIAAPSSIHSLYSSLGRERISYYRAAQGGTVYHLVGSVSNDPTTAYISFVDTTLEATLITKPELDNVTLSNVPLPNCTVLSHGNQRTFASGFDNPDEVRASKFLDVGPVRFNDSDLSIFVPSTGTPITAMGTLGDELIVFKESHIFSVAGDGPDDTGAGGTFDVPRTITNSLGCTNPRSLVLVPSGLMFQSGKGIYLLGADHSLQYIGADVEDFNSEVITSAVALPFNNEVRFQTASRTLVYDYVQQTWSEWTIKGVEAFLYQGKYTYRETSTGPLLQEVDGFFLDVDQTYQMEIETPWMTTAGAQGSQSVLALYFLGDYKSKHMARVRISYNYEDGLAETVYWDPVPVVSASLGTLQGMNTTGTNSTGVYQYMVRVPHPKCQSIKVNVCDVSEGGEAPQEAFALTEIALLMATKVGPMKLGKEKRTG